MLEYDKNKLPIYHIVVYSPFEYSEVRSAEITTDLYVSGTILPAPQWQDQNANVITLISFSFDAAVAGSASQDVDSASFNFILRDTNNSGEV